MGAITSGDAISRYSRAVAALESSQRFGMHPSLSGIRALTSVLGQPQDAFSSVQVTGTNGKTSVTRMVAALLRAHGLPTASYTSPHLLQYTERIEIDGAPVAPEEFAEAAEAALAAQQRLAAGQLEALGLADDALVPGEAEAAFTEFELLTAAALWLMRERAVRWAVLEVGMGGRWDATSVVSPAVAVVTGVALDHTRHLGETIAAIAEDKAHVIKPGCTAVLGPGTEEVDSILALRAAEQGAGVVRVRGAADETGADVAGDRALVTYKVVSRPTGPDDITSLHVEGVHATYDLALRAPAYQASNAAVAIAAAEAALGVALDERRTAEALRRLTLPGRFDVLTRDPYVVADGAHNPAAAAVLAEALADAFPSRPPVAVLAVLSDKDAAGIVAALAPHVSRFVVSASSSPRALPAEELAALVRQHTAETPAVAPTVADAISVAANGGDAVVTGSLTTAGEAIAWARGREI